MSEGRERKGGRGGGGGVEVMNFAGASEACCGVTPACSCLRRVDGSFCLQSLRY